MPFLYKFLIDNKEVDVEMGFTTSRKWEEALDEASLVVPFTLVNQDPEKMFSLLEVEITEIEDYESRKVVGKPIEKQYLIFSDKVENVGNYGYYRHNLSGIEYTAKLDVYFINQLAKSRSILTNQLAPFTKNRSFLPGGGDDESQIHSIYAENLNIKKTYVANKTITFKKVGNIATWNRQMNTGSHYVKRNYTYISTNADLISGTKPHFINQSDANWVFPKGNWEIYYGYATYSQEEEKFYYNDVFTFYIKVVEEDNNTMYDVVNEIRDMISKFGGIEDTIYYDLTRVFDIDPKFNDLLKNTQAPQTYLNTATARQMLIYVLSFINALPRLEYGKDRDLLTLERYNLNTGEFGVDEIIGRGSQQNTNQIGTRNYQMISQGLSGDFNDPSIVTPSHSQVQSVRSLDIQITDENFGIKLPENAPLYMPIKLVVKIPNVKIDAYVQKEEVMHTTKKVNIVDTDDFELDLTSRFINSEEWKLKEITYDLPTIENKKWHNVDIGLRNWKVENLQWNIGDTLIKLSDIYGEIFKNNLINNVVDIALKEWFELNVPYPFMKNEDDEDVVVSYFNLSRTLPNYKNWKFRLEYISDERLVIKQDKEDISQIDFYSEMRQNQEESLVNIVRQSKKAYGDLQRTGNIFPSFTKKHESLGEFYEIGQKDKNGYTITQIDTQWFNDFALATYYVTKHHNRIQQATFINQAYRPFDNFTKNALERHEYYGDYLMAVPPNYDTLLEEHTKLYSNDKTVRQISNILLGNKPILNSSVSTALVRTDGMLEENPDNNDKFNFISIPVTSRGIKGGLTFTFGFKGNMVAGDGLVADGSKYYNQAVRYTDTSGRFSRFGFNLLSRLEYENNGETEYEKYPLVTYSENYANNDLLNDTYIWCGNPSSESGYDYPLVWNKDPLTNTNLTYGINILSYNTNQYIFGTKFFTDNFLVRTYTTDEINEYERPILFLYKDEKVEYDMFDEIYIKDTSKADLVRLSSSNTHFDSETNTISFLMEEFDNRIKSWAIGIPSGEDIELLVACNEGINGLKFVKRHIRPNVREIGDKSYQTKMSILRNKVYAETNINEGIVAVDLINSNLDIETNVVLIDIISIDLLAKINQNYYIDEKEIMIDEFSNNIYTNTDFGIINTKEIRVNDYIDTNYEMLENIVIIDNIYSDFEISNNLELNIARNQNYKLNVEMPILLNEPSIAVDNISNSLELNVHTLDIDVITSLLPPIVTTVSKNYCKQITYKIQNDNSFIVRTYLGDIYIGEIHPYRSMNYTGSHDLNMPPTTYAFVRSSLQEYNIAGTKLDYQTTLSNVTREDVMDMLRTNNPILYVDLEVTAGLGLVIKVSSTKTITTYWKLSNESLDRTYTMVVEFRRTGFVSMSALYTETVPSACIP